jgi:MYXO-CTERM domain-containing protein
MATRSRWRLAVATSALALLGCHEHVACTPVLGGEAGQLEFHDVRLIADACDRIHSVRALVTGSRFCPTIACQSDVPGCGDDEDALTSAEVRACYDDTLAGPVVLDDEGCIVAMAPGELDWTFTPTDCPAAAGGYERGAERLRLPIVAADEVTASLVAPGDAFAVRELVDAHGGAFPADAQLAPGREALVLADERVPFAVVLAHADHADPLAWNPEQWSLVVEGADVEPIWNALGVVDLALPAGARVDLAIARDDVEIPIGTIRAIAASEIASLDVVVGFVPDDEQADGHGPPIGARAVARTADGAPVWGVPVEWEVTEGALPVWRDEQLPWSTDYVALMDRDARACHAPPEHSTTYSATLVASWGEFEVEAPMRWAVDAVDESAGEQLKEFFAGEDHRNADACEGPGFAGEGCSCSSSPGGPGAAAYGLAGVVILALRRRRRRD